MSSFEKIWAAGEYFQTPFQHLRETIFGAFSGGDSEQSESSADSFEVNDNVIGNNAAILLADNAQSTVNFLYINPIQFFNDGRAGDIYLDITLRQDDGLVML